MNFRHAVLASLLLFCSAASAAPVWEERDDFAAPALAARWDAPPAYAVKDGALRGHSLPRAFAVWDSAPLAQALSVEATVTPRNATSADWKTAVVGIYLNDAIYWHLALVEGPDANNKNHFCELSEMYQSRWNAQGEGDTLLTTDEETGNFEWQYNKTYRMRLTITAGANPQIRGEIFEGETSLFLVVRKLDAPAVKTGRPMLTTGNFAVDFDNAIAQVQETAPETPATVKLTPNGQGFFIENGALKLVGNAATNAAFDQIFWREKSDAAWQELGLFKPLMHIITDGQDQWLEAEALTKYAVTEQSPRRLVLTTEFARTTAPLFKAAYCVTILAGKSHFKSQCLWVENSGTAPWKLAGYFHYPVPKLNGDAADDDAGAEGSTRFTPPAAAWRDASGLQFGVAAPPADDRIGVRFFKDANFHGDCRRNVERDLPAGQRWKAVANEPEVLVFGTK